MGWNSYYDAPLLQGLLNATGIPPIDKLALIQNDGRLLASGTALSLPIVNVSSYPTVLLNFTNGGIAFTGLTERAVGLAWFSDAAGTDQVGADLITVPCTGPGVPLGGVLTNGTYVRAVLPTRAPYLQITYPAVALGTNTALQTRLYGSYRFTTRRYWTIYVSPAPTVANALTPTDTTGSPMKAEFHGSANAATIYTGFPNVTVPGRILLRYLIQSIATTPSNLIMEDYSGTNIATVQFPVSTGPAFGSIEFSADRAFQVIFQNASSTATGYDLSFGFDAWQ